MVRLRGVGAPRGPRTAARRQIAAHVRRIQTVGRYVPRLKTADDPTVNQSGLNGLSVGGTDALESGKFTVSAVQPIQYTVREVQGLLDPSNKTLISGVLPDSVPLQLAPPNNSQNFPPEEAPKRMVVVDSNVYDLFGDQIRTYFAAQNTDLELLVLPTCEQNKDFDLVFEVAEKMEKAHLNRRKEPLIAIGGGVCLDICGLAANLFRRNTPIIKVPTTLMAVVDASIGIKTGVNFIGKKNKLGTYCPPLAVFTDLSFLRTNDDRNLANGSAEILKMACVKDQKLFELLEEHAADLMATSYQCKASSQVIRRSIQGMLEELEYNLYEHILVRLVDYGHTFSMEVEMAGLGDGMLHGEAVSIDMAVTTCLSRNRGLLSESETDRVFEILADFGLPIWHDVCENNLMWEKALDDISKTRDGLQRMPLMHGIGRALFVDDVTVPELLLAVQDLKSRAKTHPQSYMQSQMLSTPQQGAVALKSSPITASNRLPSPQLGLRGVSVVHNGVSVPSESAPEPTQAI